MTTTQLARRLSISQSAATLLEGRAAAVEIHGDRHEPGKRIGSDSASNVAP
jgi:hypothetical protein